MKLLSLRATHFRNIDYLDIHLNSRINVIYGDNGSGKSTLLEMVYCLSRGRSFRTHLSSPMIQYQADNCTVFANVSDEQLATSIGFKKDSSGQTTLKIGHEKKPSTVQALSQLLPVQLFHPDSHHFLKGGPSMRRQFVDWGLFYTEPQFIPLWQRFQKALKQRNALVSQKQSGLSIRSWDIELADIGEQLSQFRANYAHQLMDTAKAWIISLVGQSMIQLGYEPGWDTRQSLLSSLSDNLDKDLRYGYTVSGPHRFDLSLRSNGFSVEKVLSRGEQRRLICALYLAQGEILRQMTQRSCVYLLDDILSELDVLYQTKVLEALKSLESQVLVTSLDLKRVELLLGNDECQPFHLVQGRLQ